MEITYKFATRDDCLDCMVPSDLREVVVERDKLRDLVDELLDHIRNKPNFNGFTCDILQRMDNMRNR
jgi:hypothetical protein